MAIVCPDCGSKETSTADQRLLCDACGQTTFGLMTPMT